MLNESINFWQLLTGDLSKDWNTFLRSIIGEDGHWVVHVRGQVSDWGRCCVRIKSEISDRIVWKNQEIKRSVHFNAQSLQVCIYVLLCCRHHTDLELTKLVFCSHLSLMRVSPMTYPLSFHLEFWISTLREVPLEVGNGEKVLNPRKYKCSMCDYSCADDQNQGIHIDPNDKHFWAEVDSFRCWGQTHDTDVRLWRRAKNKSNKTNKIIQVTTLEKVQRAILGVKWRLLELLSQNGHTTQALAYEDMCTTQLDQSANTEWAIQHMLSAVITTHALTTHRTALMLELISAPQIYNWDFIHKLAIIQWNQGCLAVPEVTLDGTQQHMLYIRGI